MNLNDFFVFPDGGSIEDLRELGVSRTTLSLMRSRELFENGRVNFVGAIIGRESQVVLVLPKTCIATAQRHQESLPNKFRQLGFSVIQAIQRYTRETGSQRSVEDITFLPPEDSRGQVQFAAAFSVIHDWRSFGWLAARLSKEEISEDPSRVSWHRTLSRIEPFWIGETPVFTTFVVTRPMQDLDDEITAIQTQCLRDASNLTSWLTGDSPERFATAGRRISRLDPNSAIRLIERRMGSEFEDRRLSILRNLRSFLNAQVSHQDDTPGLVVGLSYFHRVWEAMCGRLLGDEYRERFEADTPQPVYREQERVFTSRARQVPDIAYEDVCEGGAKIVVADAKYYDVSSNLPGWGDLGKQFLYGAALEASQTTPIKNVLVFPTPQTEIRPRDVRMEDRSGTVFLELGVVHCAYFPMETVIKKYVEGALGVADFRATIRSSFNLATGA